MSMWNQFGLQDGMSPTMEEFIFFHDYLMVVLVFIMTVVGGMMLQLMSSIWVNRGLMEGQMLECIWTLVPALILVMIAGPSLTLLYSLDEGYLYMITLKVVGHQWYWSYELADFWSPVSGEMVEMDCYMSDASESMGSGEFRLLETDNRPALPFLSQIRSLISSADVLHSWAVPALGVKMDANPGRLNQTGFISHRPGVAYGQCSEICGANHSFMPIALEFVAPKDFLTWVSLFEG